MLRFSLILLSAMLLGGCATAISTVNGNQAVEEDRGSRSFGAMVDDSSIETAIKVNLRANEELRKAHISVISFNATVLLVGQVPSQDLKNEATRIATSASSRIKTVHNELEVAGATTFLSRSNDAWLSAKLKTLMLADAEVSGMRTKVVTENGVVYLMGLVTQAEADKTVNLVSNSRGVTKVVRAFEYID
jgi:osmotically-inducible protein OsmY